MEEEIKPYVAVLGRYSRDNSDVVLPVDTERFKTYEEAIAYIHRSIGYMEVGYVKKRDVVIYRFCNPVCSYLNK